MNTSALCIVNIYNLLLADKRLLCSKSTHSRSTNYVYIIYICIYYKYFLLQAEVLIFMILTKVCRVYEIIIIDGQTMEPIYCT